MIKEDSYAKEDQDDYPQYRENDLSDNTITNQDQTNQEGAAISSDVAENQNEDEDMERAEEVK